MSFRTWQVAAIVLTGLLALIAVFGIMTARRASHNDERLEALYRHHREVDAQLHRLRSEVHLSSIFIRDFLLDTTADQHVAYREQLAAYRRSNLNALDELRRLLPDSGELRDRTATLLSGLEQYWEAFAPLFEWTPAQKSRQSLAFLKQEVVPRREEVLNIAREIEELNSANVAAENRDATRQAASHLGDLQLLLWQTLGLGLVVSMLFVGRFRVLELRAAQEHARAETATERMRVLSMEIVANQEAERKKLSRELHDDIGQMLTGLRMELGRLERLGTGTPGLSPAIAESRAMLDDAVRSVRDLAMGLRPSMLDDFGLQPALEWLIRDFSRRCGLAVATNISGDLSRLRDPHRTCVFRLVQEALTNCARHSNATSVAVEVKGDDRGLMASVSDNGVGIEGPSRAPGLGLRGLEERARELDGSLEIHTAPGMGTTVQLWIPLPAQEATP
jgi:signal transduction histidine kinase